MKISVYVFGGGCSNSEVFRDAVVCGQSLKQMNAFGQTFFDVSGVV